MEKEDATVGFKDEGRGHEPRHPLKAGKEKERDSPLEPLGGISSAYTMILAPLGAFWTSGLQTSKRINLGCSKSTEF